MGSVSLWLQIVAAAGLLLVGTIELMMLMSEKAEKSADVKAHIRNSAARF